MMDYKFVMSKMVNDIFAGFKTLSIQLNRFTYIKESKQPKWLGNWKSTISHKTNELLFFLWE